MKTLTAQPTPNASHINGASLAPIEGGLPRAGMSSAELAKSWQSIRGTLERASRLSAEEITKLGTDLTELANTVQKYPPTAIGYVAFVHSSGLDDIKYLAATGTRLQDLTPDILRIRISAIEESVNIAIQGADEAAKHPALTTAELKKIIADAARDCLNIQKLFSQRDGDRGSGRMIRCENFDQVSEQFTPVEEALTPLLTQNKKLKYALVPKIRGAINDRHAGKALGWLRLLTEGLEGDSEKLSKPAKAKTAPKSTTAE